MTQEDYKEYANIITEKLDNTNEYALWLAIQMYVEELQLAFDCIKIGLEKNKNKINKIKEYCKPQIENNENLIEMLEGTNSFRIGNAKSKITDFKNILEIIEK